MCSVPCCSRYTAASAAAAAAAAAVAMLPQNEDEQFGDVAYTVSIQRFKVRYALYQAVLFRQ